MIRTILYRLIADLRRKLLLNKLRKGDIKIVSEGIQLRKWLRENGYGTLKEFTKHINYSYNTLKSGSYIGQRIKRPEFMKKFYKATGVEVCDIVISPEDQALNLFFKVLNTFQSYCSGTIDILKELSKVTKQYGQKYELLSNLLLAHHYSDNNSIEEALEILDEAKDIASQNFFYDILIYVGAEYAYTYLVQNKSLKALMAIENLIAADILDNVLKENITELNKKILYIFHYRYGLALVRNKRYTEGREKLNDAMKYTDDVTRVYNNIALSYRLENDIETSVKHYYKALKVSKKIVDTAAVYNNLANTFYKSDNISGAKKCINDCMRLIDTTFHICEIYNYLDTYLMVYEHKKGCIKFRSVWKWMKDISRCTNYNYTEKFLFGLIKYCILNSYMVQLERMFALLYDAIQQEKKDDIANSLRALGYKAIYYRKEMEEHYEKN